MIKFSVLRLSRLASRFVYRFSLSELGELSELLELSGLESSGSPPAPVNGGWIPSPPPPVSVSGGLTVLSLLLLVCTGGCS